jgi:thiamine pyrophosphate-dependent acetolactate synthase large subunit-like protein
MRFDAAIPHDWMIVNASGHVSGFTAQMQRRPFGNFLTVREFGAIGIGTSFALGAAAARPGEPVVLLDGDGSLLMHIQELETIARHNLPVLIAVLNDGAYGSEILKLRARGFSDTGAVFGSPDFKAIASGFGFISERVTDLASLGRLVADLGHSRTPYLIDLPIRQDIVSGQMRKLAARH